MGKSVKSILVTFLLCICALSAWAQADYENRGDAEFAAGSYAAAKTKYSAQLAVFDSKKVDRTSPEYSRVIDKMARAEICASLYQAAKKSFDNAKAQGDDAAYNAAIRDLNALLHVNPKDEWAKKAVSICRGGTAASRDSELWAKARREHTERAYQEYLDKTTSDAYRAEAERQLNLLEDESLWQQAIEKNTVEAYEDYINSTMTEVHAAEARRRIEALGDTGDAKLWNAALVFNTITAYEKYIETSQDGTYIEQAKAKIEQLKIEKDKTLWEEAKEEDTIEAYKRYLSETEEGAYSSIAEDSINNLAYKEDSRLWIIAHDENTLQSYQRYLSNSEYLFHKDEAEEAIESFEQKILFAQIKQLYSEGKTIDKEKREAAIAHVAKMKKRGDRVEGEMLTLYNIVKEENDYYNFMEGKDLQKGLLFLHDYSETSRYYNDVSNAVARLYATERNFREAELYAKDKETKKYIHWIKVNGLRTRN